MNNKSFYSKMGFNTLLDYCYAVGNISLEKLTEIYYKSFGRRNEFDEIFFYDILEPIYNNIQEYIKPSTRSEKMGDEIFIAMLNLEKITEPYSLFFALFTSPIMKRILIIGGHHYVTRTKNCS